MSTGSARGLRNNNPGNIRKSAVKWKGEVGGEDSEFVTFISAAMGIRALAKTLQTYQEKHGLSSVRGIINRWAPPNENNTEAYISFVAKAVGVDPDENLDPNSLQLQAALTRAIITQENGSCPYSADELLEGVRLALPATAEA